MYMCLSLTVLCYRRISLTYLQVYRVYRFSRPPCCTAVFLQHFLERDLVVFYEPLWGEVRHRVFIELQSETTVLDITKAFSGLYSCAHYSLCNE